MVAGPADLTQRQWQRNFGAVLRKVWRQGRKAARLFHKPPLVPSLPPPMDSEDLRPWEHPYLTAANIRRFREYSLAVRDIALRHRRAAPRDLDIGFCINIAQNTYKWARMLQGAGARATLYLHGWDKRALTCPEWEEFDGEWPDVMDGPGFQAAFPRLEPKVPCVTYALDELGPYHDAWKKWKRGDRKPLLALQAANPDLRFES